MIIRRAPIIRTSKAIGYQVGALHTLYTKILPLTRYGSGAGFPVTLECQDGELKTFESEAEIQGAHRSWH